jgi:hypothetical protein
MFSPNVGNKDKFIRTTLALTLALLAYTQVLSGPLGLAALGIAFLLIATGYLRFCPLYKLLGIRTCPAPPSKQP